VIEHESEQRQSILEQPPDEFLNVCAICGSCRYHLIHNRGAIYNDPKHTLRLDTHICHRCGVIFSNPRLSEKEVREFYRHEQGVLHNNQDINYLANQSPKALTKVRIHYFSQWLTDSPQRILEIGGGVLNFGVSLAHQYPNIHLDELDPSLPHNHHLLSNLRLISGFMDKEFPDSISDRYNIIVAFHVLEHQHNPKEFLTIIKKALTADGLFFLEVPYPFSPFWIRKPIDACFRTVHPFNFTIRSLKYLLQDSGFTVLSYDISSLAMLRVAAQATKGNANFVPISKHDLRRIDRFFRSWKLYSGMNKIKPLSRFAHMYAEWVWHRNQNINQQ